MSQPSSLYMQSTFMLMHLNIASALLLLLSCGVQNMFTLGQKMVEWNQLDVASFLEQATGFLAEHGQLDGPSCHAPPAKRARSVGLSSHVSPLILALFSLFLGLCWHFLGHSSELLISCRAIIWDHSYIS